MAKNTTSPTRAILWISIFIILIVAAVVAASAMRSSRTSETRRVTFRVESAGGYANITIKAGNFVIDKPQTVTTPWEKTVELERSQTVFLTAANPTQTGQLTCKILLDRKVWKMESIPAPKDGVACAGIIP